MNQHLKIISTKLPVVLDLLVRPFFGKEILIAENNCWDELEYYWNLKEDYESKKVLNTSGYKSTKKNSYYYKIKGGGLVNRRIPFKKKKGHHSGYKKQLLDHHLWKYEKKICRI